MARVSQRASPLMETLGGFAVAASLMYGGYRVVATGATPGEFFSFLTAFLLFLRFVPMISMFEVRTLLPQAKVKAEHHAH